MDGGRKHKSGASGSGAPGEPGAARGSSEGLRDLRGGSLSYVMYFHVWEMKNKQTKLLLL